MERATRKRKTPISLDFSDEEKSPVVPALVPPVIPRQSPIPPPEIIGTLPPELKSNYIKPIPIKP